MQQQQSCPSTVPFCSSPSPAIATDEFQAKDDEMRSLKAQNAGLLEQLKVIQNLNLNLDIDTRLTLHNLNPNTNPHWRSNKIPPCQEIYLNKIVDLKFRGLRCSRCSSSSSNSNANNRQQAPGWIPQRMQTKGHGLMRGEQQIPQWVPSVKKGNRSAMLNRFLVIFSTLALTVTLNLVLIQILTLTLTLRNPT